MTIKEKAERLLLAGNVNIRLREGQLTAEVQGDHDYYRLFREGARWRCTCKARKRCSHIEAVERVT